MATVGDSFPLRDRLWEGAILGFISHAIMVCRYPDLAHEQAWDGYNYSIQDSTGTKGTITFAQGHAVGAFFDKASPRNPFKSGQHYNLDQLLVGIPVNLRSLAFGESFQYLLQEIEGRTEPVVTAVFWDDGIDLTAAEPWNEIVKNGAHLIRRQLLDLRTAETEWQRYYKMPVAHVTLAQSIAQQKIAAPNVPLALSREQWAMVTTLGSGHEESRTSFGEIGIAVP